VPQAGDTRDELRTRDERRRGNVTDYPPWGRLRGLDCHRTTCTHSRPFHPFHMPETFPSHASTTRTRPFQIFSPRFSATPVSILRQH
jgi:hypothetical protein